MLLISRAWTQSDRLVRALREGTALCSVCLGEKENNLE